MLLLLLLLLLLLNADCPLVGAREHKTHRRAC